MELTAQLQKAVVVKRQNGLILDARLEDGSVVAVFCASAEVSALCVPGISLFLKKIRQPQSRIKYELEFIKLPEALILANPSYRRHLFREAFQKKVLEDFATYASCRRIESGEGLNNVDFELTAPDGSKCMVFIDTVYTKEGTSAVFPSKRNFFEFAMFEEMKKLRGRGMKTAVFILVPRMDCLEAKFSWKFDPAAAAGIFEEAKNGLNFVCYGCNIDKNSVTISKKMHILY